MLRREINVEEVEKSKDEYDKKRLMIIKCYKKDDKGKDENMRKERSGEGRRVGSEEGNSGRSSVE